MSRNVLPSVICVTKLLDIVGNLCYVIGEPTLKNCLCRKFNLLDQKEEKILKKFKIVLAAQKNQICRKQLKGQETTGKTSRNKTIKAEQETKRNSQTVQQRNKRSRVCHRKFPNIIKYLLEIMSIM